MRSSKELRYTIQKITENHIKKYKTFVFGQNLLGVGGVDNTLPKSKKGIVDLPMADVAGGGIVAGSAMVKKKPIYIIRYQGYNWFNMIFIINYACKSKFIWKIPCPMWIRGIANEGSIGPVAGSSHISIFYKMPGIKIFSPMTNAEYIQTYKNFEKDDDVYYISEHKKSFSNKKRLNNFFPKDPDLILTCISITRFEAESVKNYFLQKKKKIAIYHLYKLKPLFIPKNIKKYFYTSKNGILISDNDYVDGLARIIAHKITDQCSFKVKVDVIGLKDKVAGHHTKVDVLPPSCSDLIKKINNMCKF
jgi:sulfopyruvate decarboxylase TPP-binding subunit